MRNDKYGKAELVTRIRTLLKAEPNSNVKDITYEYDGLKEIVKIIYNNDEYSLLCVNGDSLGIIIKAIVNEVYKEF